MTGAGLAEARRGTATASDLAAYLERVAGGDRAAFAALYRATSRKLFGIVARILRRREVAEDILQDVYVRIWERAADFDAGRASPITWMATIARNRALDEARRRVPDLAADDAALAAFPDGQIRADEAMEADDALRRLQDCLNGLDAPRRTLIVHAYLDGLSRQELAHASGQPVGTIKTWLHRSLKQLKDCLGS